MGEFTPTKSETLLGCAVYVECLFILLHCKVTPPVHNVYLIKMICKLKASASKFISHPSPHSTAQLFYCKLLHLTTMRLELKILHCITIHTYFLFYQILKTKLMNKLFLVLAFSCCTYLLKAQQTDLPYDYSVKLNTEKWQTLKSVEDMYNACQIPQDVLSKMATPALLQTCLNFPASAVLLIHNTPQQGFDDWKQHFNGINELLKRSDAEEVLLKAYSIYDTKTHTLLKTAIEKGHYTFILTMLESILVQDEITSSLNTIQQKALLKICLQKYQDMETDEVYGFNSITSTGRIITKLSGTLGDDKLKAQIDIPIVGEFIKTGFLTDRQTLLDIISSAQKINTNE